MMKYKKLNEETLTHIEKCELTGDSIVEYIDKSIPFNRCIRLQGFNADQLVREVCRILKDKGIVELIEATKKILENEDKREIMRKEARNEAEKWDWNQATLQLQNYYSDTLKEID